MTELREPEGRGHVLIADDEPELLKAMARLLKSSGYRVDTVPNGDAAIGALDENSYDAIVSDISMPGLTGIELLKVIQERDPDVPVILVTGAPAVESAVAALEHGAYKYLLKPVSPERLEDVVQKAVHLGQMARIRREAAEVIHPQRDAELHDAFASAMGSLWMAYQPIVGADGLIYGHEALLRSRERRLPHPGAILDAAERLGELHALGRLVRARAALPVARAPDAGLLFVNLHPRDLLDDDLTAAGSALARIASRVVLEITERSSVGSIVDLRQTVARLRECGFSIAIDDLGAGYAGLTSFALLEPEIVKIDMSLVREVQTSSVKQRLIRSVTTLCSDMGIKVVAEGIETVEERDALLELGCDLFQGYFIARPAEPFPSFHW
jgi:EAL domain-containing protein (putative c-di-GMP-specific phosphodiesterase class I)/CheY-like chemotaxis protein